MRRGPRWRSRRPWGSIRALAWLALAVAPACAGSPSAGFRPGVDGGGTPGSGGSNGATGGSGSGTGGASSSGGTGGSIGPVTDGGTVADALPPFDGGTCTASGSQNTDPNMTAASGSFSGALTGAVCAGGTFAYVQSTPADDGGAPLVELLIATLGAGDPAARIRFQEGAELTDGELAVDIGISAAATGTYVQDVTCGSAELFANLPGPDPSICATDAGGFDCPDGCQSTGPDQPCTPIPPQVVYAALSASDCHGDSTTPAGSWTVTLTSVTAEPDAGTGTLGSLIYRVHGTLTATLADQDPDGGAAGLSLSLTF
jgi:hypothetical protein